MPRSDTPDPEVKNEHYNLYASQISLLVPMDCAKLFYNMIDEHNYGYRLPHLPDSISVLWQTNKENDVLFSEMESWHDSEVYINRMSDHAGCLDSVLYIAHNTHSMNAACKTIIRIIQTNQ